MLKAVLFTFSSFASLTILGACSSSDATVDFTSNGGNGGSIASGGATISAGGSAMVTAGRPGTAGSAGASAAGTSSGGEMSAGAGGVGGASGSAGSVDLAGATSGGAAGSVGISSSTLTLASPDFTAGSAIPVAATCATTNPMPALPALSWSSPPVGTKSFALTFLDNTRLPSPQGMHYAIWDIPADVMSLPNGLAAGSPPTGVANLVGAKQKNPFAARYLGPCPNNTDASSDTYAFTLYALSQAQLPGNLTDVASVVSAIQAANPLGKAILTGTSDAKGTLR